MNKIVIILLTIVACFSAQAQVKYRHFHGQTSTWMEFNTQAEHDAHVAADSPTPDMTNIVKSLEHEAIGKQVIKDLYISLRAQNLTQAQEADLINRLNPVLIALQCGFIRGARTIANNLTVAGELTNARKTFILNTIDAAILQL